MSIYIPVKTKFAIVFALALIWMAVSLWLSIPWFRDLSDKIGWLLAGFLIAFIAIIPGFMNAFLLSSILFDRRPRAASISQYPPVTVLVPAFNEAAAIADTMTSIFKQDYPGMLKVLVVNDGSRDATAERIRELQARGMEIELINILDNGGKSAALNRGLSACTTEILITIDADSYLKIDAIRNIVERYLSDPPNTRAVAGEILIRNSRTNWITRAQEWDYFLGIAAIKRAQSLFQGTLVAQGAFSLYDRATVANLGGWPDALGEDIVLSWKILRAGFRIGHAENACAFTNCPDTLKKFVYQRRRWSRGMIEAFKANPGILRQPRLSTMYVWWNSMFPMIDLSYSVGFIPGLALACFGKFWIVGPMTLALLPVSVLLNRVMFNANVKMFRDEGLQVRTNRGGLFFYMLAYGLILQPACVWGYASEIFGHRKTWGTK
ncbi:MAG TPA: glycosyltransferase [Gallionellaceae bacterium]